MHLTASLTLGGLHPPIGRQFRQMAEIAELGGLDAIWLGHGTGAPACDPLPVLGSLIAVTRRIGLGAWWSVDHAEPFHVARVFATLDHLSGGRTAWLVGLGDSDEDLFRHAPRAPGEAAARAAEFVDVVNRLCDSWEDEAFRLDVASGMFADPARVHPLHHRGRFFAVRGPLNVPRPVQGRPVIALTEAASGVAGDLLLASWSDPAEAAARMPALRAAGLRVLVNLTPDLRAGAHPVATMMAEWIGRGCCDGFNLMPAVLPDDLAACVAEVVPLLQAYGLRPRSHEGRTLRDHLGLARPRNCFAA